MKVLDLFSGIGGFSIGLEKVGFETVAFCEIEPYCQAVIRKHWPDTPIYNDVRSVNADRLAADGHDGIDVITAGFPCQDISIAGHGAGLDGERSGLWSEVARIVGEIRPRWVMLENVAALLGRGMGRVIGDLAAIGYDAQWEVISASAVGAPHRRQRVWIVAHDRRKRRQGVAPVEIFRQQAFSWCDDVRGAADIPDRPDLYPSKLCGSGNGIRKRLHALGNSIVPQIPEMIGRAIVEAEGGL
jgi:DNA (cytosine-5)-methyltransferase 1